MALPNLQITINNNMWGIPNEGNLSYKYHAFYNLLDSDNPVGNNSLKGLCLPLSKSGLNIDKPLQLETEVCYDDSINLIITDQENPAKIVNSRFYQVTSDQYAIADRKGNLDTNIYSEDTFTAEASLIKTTRTIVSLDFLGIKDGGQMPIGNYTFYFRLADSDGNQSDFIAESGKVVCHIGGVNKPTSIRGGQLNENSNKLISFRLNNLDLSYDYIDIYYTRSTGDGSNEIIKTYKVNNKFKITNSNTEISITGYEDHEEISSDDINTLYESFRSIKTLANCQNISFAGNISNNYEKFLDLEKLSLLITPSLVYDEEGIGNLNHNYVDQYTDFGGEYYNASNIYYKLGYWDEEIYRFGVVYIMNDYTLSPVFNIRGKKSIGLHTTFDEFKSNDVINYGEDYIIVNPNSETNDENIKGVFKIDAEEKSIFNDTDSIKPIGIKFNIHSSALETLSESLTGTEGLKDLTKGCFFVRQQRIPTILAQSIGIGTSLKASIPMINAFIPEPGQPTLGSWISESFLKVKSDTNKPMLASELFKVPDVYNNQSLILHNALLCPEASLRTTLYNSFFNSSEFTLKSFKYGNSIKSFSNYVENYNHFVFPNLLEDNTESEIINAELTLIESGINKLNIGNYSFCSQAGDSSISYKHVDPILGDFEDLDSSMHWIDNGDHSKGSKWNTTTTKVRGEFNTFIGCNKNNITHGRYYNIFQQGYDFETKWKDYFLVRYNDSSSFFPVTDRITWDQYQIEEPIAFRGDCYINTYTHRMNWNFIDPELPTNHRIIDPYTWIKNFRISEKTDKLISVNVADSNIDTTTLTYKKLLPLFTYTKEVEASFLGEVTTNDGLGIKEPTDKKYKKYSDLNGVFGADKISRPDVNAVGLGHWVTFKICSNINLAMRDLDYTRPAEEALHRQKRGFYPLQALNKNNSLPESTIINNGISKSLGDKYYFEVPDVPFLKTSFTNRINYSYPLQQSSFTNNNRIFEKKNYEDYTLEYGALVKLVEWYGTLIAIMEHGVLMIPVNERAMMTNASGENVYINTDNVLPKNPKVLSNTFGSLWEDSVIKTSRYIYGIDTVAKKIWRTNGEKFEIISDLKIQKFLNDNIKLKESDQNKLVKTNFIKSHYNAFKQDILFVFLYDSIAWHLCWNELSDKWVTQYTWFPEFSENINNIFYTFANTNKHILAKNKLYKHGFAGTEDLAGEILPTKWYDEQQPFEFEFVVNSIQGIQKIFDNLKIISNNVEPNSFIYEIVGDGYDWSTYKGLILDRNNEVIPDSDIIGIGFGYPFPWLL